MMFYGRPENVNLMQSIKCITITFLKYSGYCVSPAMMEFLKRSMLGFVPLAVRQWL